MNTCKCGGTLVGNGFTEVVHCEFAEVTSDIECDAPVIFCDYQEE